jgi:hypothetical protein
MTSSPLRLHSRRRHLGHRDMLSYRALVLSPHARLVSVEYQLLPAAAATFHVTVRFTGPAIIVSATSCTIFDRQRVR